MSDAQQKTASIKPSVWNESQIWLQEKSESAPMQGQWLFHTRGVVQVLDKLQANQRRLAHQLQSQAELLPCSPRHCLPLLSLRRCQTNHAQDLVLYPEMLLCVLLAQVGALIWAAVCCLLCLGLDACSSDAGPWTSGSGFDCCPTAGCHWQLHQKRADSVSRMPYIHRRGRVFTGVHQILQ